MLEKEWEAADRQAEALRLLALPLDRLFLLLGREIVPAGVGIVPEDPEPLIRLARRWLSDQRVRLRSLLCEEEARERYRNEADQVVLVTTLAATLCGSRYSPSSAMLTAAILVRLGLDVICDEHSTPPELD
jgi:hypothetical protein